MSKLAAHSENGYIVEADMCSMYCIHQTYSFRGLTLRVVETQIVANMTSEQEQIARVQVALPLDEFKAIDDFRFRHRMPNRSAAVRELIRQGLAATNRPPPEN
jgi:hypothetical protein